MLVVLIFLILTSSLMRVIFCLPTDTSNQQFDRDSFEKGHVSDQNKDATISADSEPFKSNNKDNYFMDLYSIQTGPKQIEFGHVFEDPHTWEQRYERKDHENKRFQGQARWGDKHGGYGEQYWDYNHGGDVQEEGAGNEEIINGEFSRNIKSELISPTSFVDIPGSETSDDQMVQHGENSHQQDPKILSKKLKYEEIRSRKSKSDSPSSTEPDAFVIPKQYTTAMSSNTGSQYEMNRLNTNDPYMIDMYDQLRGMHIYDDYSEKFPTAFKPKTNVETYPTTMQPSYTF